MNLASLIQVGLALTGRSETAVISVVLSLSAVCVWGGGCDVSALIPASLIKHDAGPSLEMEMRTADISHLLIYKDQGSADLYVLYQLHSSSGTGKK